MSFQHSLKLNGWMECQAFKWPWKIGISKPLFPNKPTSVKSGSPHCLYEFLHISEFCSLKAHQTCVRGCVILLSLKLLFDFGSPGVSLPSDSGQFSLFASTSQEALKKRSQHTKLHCKEIQPWISCSVHNLQSYAQNNSTSSTQL